MSKTNPPRWADRFLTWFCNPDLLEEIQGDIYELYDERLRNNRKTKADLLYFYDVLRFLRWSNIRKVENTGFSGLIWSFNFKLVVRQAQRDKLVFAIKVLGLSICLAFTLLLSAFIINEISFDRFHANATRLIRVGSAVDFHDQVTRYAVTPLPIGPAMREAIPEVENYTRFIYSGRPSLSIDDREFHNGVALTVDSNFLDLFSFPIVLGSTKPLMGPNKIVLTESYAKKLFGTAECVGKRVAVSRTISAEVTAIVRDVPNNSHLKFDMLISWDTFNHDDEWSNVNAYTYLLLQADTDIEVINDKLVSSLEDISELVARNYDGTYQLFFEKLTDIHFSSMLEEDIAEKQKSVNVLILIQVAVLFLITGLINYLNITLAEITSNLKKLGIIQIFGGMAANHHKILLSGALFTLFTVAPLVSILVYAGWKLSGTYLFIEIDDNVLINPFFIGVAITSVLLVILASQSNVIAVRAGQLTQTLKGQLDSRNATIPLRKILVGAQFTFSVAMMALILVIVDQFYFIRDADKGFNDNNTIVVEAPNGSQEKIEAFNFSLRDIDDIILAGGSSYSPGTIETRYVFEIETKTGARELLIPMIHCGYDYLETLEISIAGGRSFDPAHNGDRYYSFIVNEAAVKEFGWGKEAIGKKIKGPLEGTGDVALREGEVVGVAKDFNFASLHSRIEPLILFMSDDDWSDQFIYIKAKSAMTPDLIRKVKKQFENFWPDVPFYWQHLDAGYLSFYKRDQQIKKIFEIGLIISVLISCLGIFSFSALMASMKVKEMGIRKVMGAETSHLLFLHLITFFQLGAICILVAAPLIFYWSKSWLDNFAYHIELQLSHFLIPSVLVTIIVIVISSYHALQNARGNPIEALKHE